MSHVRYRIVTDIYAGYEVQIKTRYWPFWRECPHHAAWRMTNTHPTVAAAKAFIENNREWRLRKQNAGATVYVENTKIEYE